MEHIQMCARIQRANLNAELVEKFFFIEAIVVNTNPPNQDGQWQIRYPTFEQLSTYMRSVDPAVTHPVCSHIIILDAAIAETIVVEQQFWLPLDSPHLDRHFWATPLLIEREYLYSVPDGPSAQRQRELLLCLNEVGLSRDRPLLQRDISIIVDMRESLRGIMNAREVAKMVTSEEPGGFPGLRFSSDKVNKRYRYYCTPPDFLFPPLTPLDHSRREKLFVCLLRDVDATVNHFVKRTVLVDIALRIGVTDSPNYLDLLVRRIVDKAAPGGVAGLTVRKTHGDCYFLTGDPHILVAEVVFDVAAYKQNIIAMLQMHCFGNTSVIKPQLDVFVTDQIHVFISHQVFYHVLHEMCQSRSGTENGGVDFFIRRIPNYPNGFDMYSLNIPGLNNAVA